MDGIKIKVGAAEEKIIHEEIPELKVIAPKKPVSKQSAKPVSTKPKTYTKKKA